MPFAGLVLGQKYDVQVVVKDNMGRDVGEMNRSRLFNCTASRDYPANTTALCEPSYDMYMERRYPKDSPCYYGDSGGDGTYYDDGNYSDPYYNYSDPYDRPDDKYPNSTVKAVQVEHIRLTLG